MSDERYELEKIISTDEMSQGRQGHHRDSDLDAYAYGYDLEQEGATFHLRDVWRAIRKHKLLITIVPILVTLFIAVEVSRPKPIYTARAVVELKRDTWVVIKSGDTVIEEEPDTGLSLPTIKTNTLMLMSRPLLEDVAYRLALDKEPRFMDVTKKKAPFFATLKNLFSMAESQEQPAALEEGPQGQAGDARRAESGGQTRKPAPQGTISEERRAQLAHYVGILQSNLEVEPIRDTRVLNIYFSHTDPKLAAAVANGIAESFIDRTFQNRTSKLNRATEWLERTTNDLREKVERAEKALADYTRDHNIYASDAKDTLITEKLAKLHSEVLRAETERVIKESMYEEVKAGRLAQLPEVFSDQKLTSLQLQLEQMAVQAAQLDLHYGPKNWQVIELKQKMAVIQSQVDESRRALEEKLKAEYGRAVRDESTLKAALAAARNEAVQQNQDAVQFNLLKQEADTTRGLYTQFLQKTNQVNIQLAEQPNTVRLMEPAVVPFHPSNADRHLYILFGFFASLAACIGLAFVYERLSKTIRSVEDVSRYIQLPAIGVIPDIKTQKSRSLLPRNGKQDQDSNGGTSILKLASSNTRPVVSADDRSPAAEAYRAVSTSVLLSSGETPPKTILVTSGLPSEGKTTTTINTAISLAQLGASVLIIDCDMRNPTAHRVFNLENTGGLSTYLSSDAEIDGLICKLQISNLSLLPAGPIPRNPARLIISRKMKAMLQMLGERFDHILIDSPPLIGVTDAIILSTLVDGVIVVVHGNKSTREIARRTRQELANVGANIFGVVLNNIDQVDYEYYQPAYKYVDSQS